MASDNGAGLDTAHSANTTGIYPSDRAWERSGKGAPRAGVLIGGRPARAKQIEYALLGLLQVGGGMAGIWWAITQPTGWVVWSSFIIGYLIINFGLSVGFHRYFTHKAFDTSHAMRLILGITGQMSCQGSVKKWAPDHRRHHAFADQPGDLHSPLIDGHGRPMGGVKGLLISHMGWLWDNAHTDLPVYGKGLLGDPIVEFCDRTRWLWVAVSLVLFPAAWAIIFGGVDDIVGCILIAGFLRTFIFLNGVMGTNSVAHAFGYQRYKDVGAATNNWLIALLTLGDGWHNNHHAQPRAASNQIGWWELDFNGWTIFAMEKLGLVWNVQQRGARPRGGGAVADIAEPHDAAEKHAASQS